MSSATQPSDTYSTADSHFGAVIHTSLRTTPASAPPHTTARTTVASVPGSTRTATGV